MPGPPKAPTSGFSEGNPSSARSIRTSQNPRQESPIPKHFDKQGKYWFKRIGEERCRRRVDP